MASIFYLQLHIVIHHESFRCVLPDCIVHRHTVIRTGNAFSVLQLGLPPALMALPARCWHCHGRERLASITASRRPVGARNASSAGGDRYQPFWPDLSEDMLPVVAETSGYANDLAGTAAFTVLSGCVLSTSWPVYRCLVISPMTMPLFYVVILIG